MLSETLARELTDYACAKLTQHAGQVVRCARLLGEDEIWQRTNTHTNSVGNLILHLTGNVGQWIIAGLGGGSFNRDRRAEFAARGPLPTEQITSALQRTVEQAIDLVSVLDADGLSRQRSIQGYEVTGLVAVLHVVEHFSGHVGQIVHITKAIKDVDLSLYDADGQRQDSGLP